MTAQLTSYTNAAGQVCATGDAVNFRYGPYLRQGIPTEPFSNTNNVTIATTAPIAAVDGGTGWAYNTATGQFIKNNSAADGVTTGRTFAQH
jgi:hypothetical protein